MKYKYMKKRKAFCPLPSCPLKMVEFKKMVKDGSFRSALLGVAAKLGVSTAPPGPPLVNNIALKDYEAIRPDRDIGEVMDGREVSQFYGCIPPSAPRFETIPWLMWWRFDLERIVDGREFRVNDLVQGMAGLTPAATNNQDAGMLIKSGVLKTVLVRTQPLFADWSLWRLWRKIPFVKEIVDQRMRLRLSKYLILRVVVCDKVYWEAPAMGSHAVNIKVPTAMPYTISLVYRGGDNLLRYGVYNDIEVRTYWDLTRPLR